MKKITFNVPDETEIMHVICVNPRSEANGKSWTNLNAQFYDLRTGQTEFTPDIPAATQWQSVDERSVI